MLVCVCDVCLHVSHDPQLLLVAFLLVAQPDAHYMGAGWLERGGGLKQLSSGRALPRESSEDQKLTRTSDILLNRDSLHSYTCMQPAVLPRAVLLCNQEGLGSS